MGRFRRVALLKAHQKIEPPNHTYASDLTEIAYLGAFIEKDVEYVTIPVSPYDRHPYKVFEKALKRDKFDFVGISTMTGGYISAREYARIAKQAGAFVTMGGYHPTALTSDVLADPNVDAVVRGEGENPFRDLILHGPQPGVGGVSFKDKSGEQIHNQDQELIYDLDNLPHPARHMRPSRYGEPGWDYSIDTLYSSRGCIAKCTFCANDTVNKGFRPRSPEHFIEELKQIHRKDVKKTVKFWDSIFLFDPKRVEAIVELMFKNDLTNFRIITESRSDDVLRCEHLLKDMKRLGFEKIQIGIESPDPETFKKLKKGGRVANHDRAIDLVQDANMVVEGFLIIGHPHETEEDILDYPEYAKRMGIDHRALYFVMTPYPGTQIYREYEEKKLIDSFDWDCYNNYGTVVHLDKVPRERLRNLLSYCYGKTWGIPYMFKKRRSIPIMIFDLWMMSVMWMYFCYIQAEEGDRKKNRDDFFSAMYKAGYGSYTKKRKMKWSVKLGQMISQSTKFRIKVNEEHNVLMHFTTEGDNISMEVRDYDRKKDGNAWMITLDDLDFIHRVLGMTDVNAFMVLNRKKASFMKKLPQIIHCLPTIARTVYSLGTVFTRMMGRKLTNAR